MSEWIDVTVPLSSETPRWPGSPGFESRLFRDLAVGDGSCDSLVALDVHCGTHVEGAAHLNEHGALPGAVEQLWGELTATVVDVGEAINVDVEHLRQAELEADVVLFKTRNSHDDYWSREGFQADFAALTADAAEFLARQPGLVAVGIDYMSIQPFGGDPRSHTALLDEGVLIIEGLDLRAVQPGRYKVLALPLLAPGLEALPLRMLVRPCRD